MINLKEFNVDSELQSIADAITVNGLQFCGGVFDHMPTGEEFVLTIASDSSVKRISEHNDRLVEENAQQRESLDAFRELVKAQTQTMNELNERCKEIEKEKARLRFALHKARQGYKNLIELRALPNTGWNGEAQNLIDLCDDALE